MDSTATWLVEFRYHTPPGRTTRCFYLVNDARNPQHAQQIAAARADSPAERGKRNNRPLDATWTNMCHLHHDAIGRPFWIN
ncbi:hypothetical protein [Streptomyces sp. CA-106131]|uniref:hypothetical protein n=1 Tax=Streptomyces sp. CA-106131 TaxID=3240045 RepID=UPI003D92608F